MVPGAAVVLTVNVVEAGVFSFSRVSWHLTRTVFEPVPALAFVSW